MRFDADALSRCVGCGLCLPACPTYQVTHAEQHGPRGRIAGMRLLQRGEIGVHDAGWLESMESCVQCRACEPACPSSVQFGALMERAREIIHEHERSPDDGGGAPGASPRLADSVLRTFGSRTLLRASTVLLAFAQMTKLDRLLPARFRVARRVRVRDAFRRLPATRGTGKPAFLFRGCVMDAWFRPVHRATLRVLAAAGYEIHSEPAPPCCGALHLHAGRVDEAKRLAQEVVSAYTGTEGDVIVNSAGCGAAMREYGRLLATAEAKAFAARVRDFAEAAMRAELPALRPLNRTVMLQTACHLRNVQRAEESSEALLRRIPALRVLRPDDGDLCCGAGGAYSLLQPELANRMRENKRRALMQPEVSTVVSGNPGCILHLAAVDVPMLHIAELVASALPEDPAGLNLSSRS